ncbi:hypothetical protein TRFO_25043 [Tritrichomonas foetus]|uniref:Uncharacterized protein n=1 Tax=Tritrichomonas foetus TaxID=1144522 RepID=A0A1J4K791_9EUKA|nr:hypothetical protein TRFO_25043 [Tritrichomonas foetus]|eukprot:OHT06866.1 hypothetical protein TRFO_25043 [Tritrichomonas foetus]
MLISGQNNTIPMPPRKRITPQAHLMEKRRIVGSLRERTVYIPNIHNNSQNYESLNRNEEEKESIEQIMYEIGQRINNSIETSVMSTEIKLEQKLAEINHQIETNEHIHDSIERQLKKLKNMIKYSKYKSHSHSQPIESHRSAIAEYKRETSRTMSSCDDLITVVPYNSFLW